ncbi:MAG: TlpA family protein disulfide reductase, partial [Pyrinomonadaceae bacterium]
MRIGTPMPSLAEATEWLNGSFEKARNESSGKPTLVHFWSVSCHICKENMPRINQWRDEHYTDDLRVIAVHMPRHESDTDLSKVKNAIVEHNISEPCAVDNLHKLRDSFQNDQGYVPAYYLFDSEGKLKGFAAGEHGLDMLATSLERLLSSADQLSAACARGKA